MKRPEPKQLTMKRPKQRNIVVPRYMLRPDLRTYFNNMTKAEIFKLAHGGVRRDEGGDHEEE